MHMEYFKMVALRAYEVSKSQVTVFLKRPSSGCFAMSLSDNRYECLIFCGAITQRSRIGLVKKFPRLRTAKSS
jgi:hypothetical protein